MKTIYLHHPITTDEWTDINKVMALGFFDGVHLGHQAVIKQAKQIAGQKGLQTAVLTFDPHPSVVLSNIRKQVKYLTPLEDKAEKMAKLGVDIMYVVR
ncbi:adenylyltransferase/cytidyltransferase family protein, partial [Listeria monocytogenes]|nr:adenylyltransferase/cytidyltransferase family protein [Listeria monocytogenes]